MNTKISLTDICRALAIDNGLPISKVDGFVRTFIDLIIEGLERDGQVKISGWGTFKLVEVESRESVDVNTGARFQIKGHRKISFLPDSTLKERVNRPFSMFEVTELPDDSAEEVSPEEEETEETEQEEATNVEVKPDETADTENMIPPLSVNKEKIKEEQNGAAGREEAAVAVTEEKAEEGITEGKSIGKSVAASPLSQPAAEKRIKKLRNRFLWIVAVLIIIIICFVLAFPYLFCRTEINRMQEPTDSLQTKETTVFQREESLTVERGDTLLNADTATKERVVEKKDAESQSQDGETAQSALKNVCLITLNSDEEARALAAYTAADTVAFQMNGTLCEHRVIADETVIRIALKYYGNKKMWPYIVKYNTLRDPDGLAKGMVLKIPVLSRK